MDVLKEDPKVKTSITMCECYSHGVVVESGFPDEEIYVVSWYHGQRDLNIIDRIRTAWEALHGDVQTNCLVLNKENTDNLIDELQKARNKTFKPVS